MKRQLKPLMIALFFAAALLSVVAKADYSPTLAPIIDREGHHSNWAAFGCSNPLYCEEANNMVSAVPFDESQDQGCGYTYPALDASEYTNWLECHVKADWISGPAPQIQHGDFQSFPSKQIFAFQSL